MHDNLAILTEDMTNIWREVNSDWKELPSFQIESCTEEGLNFSVSRPSEMSESEFLVCMQRFFMNLCIYANLNLSWTAAPTPATVNEDVTRLTGSLALLLKGFYSIQTRQTEAESSCNSLRNTEVVNPSIGKISRTLEQIKTCLDDIQQILHELELLQRPEVIALQDASEWVGKVQRTQELVHKQHVRLQDIEDELERMINSRTTKNTEGS